MAPPRKRGRPKRVQRLHLVLQHPVARKIYDDLSRRGLASSYFESFLLRNHGVKVGVEDSVELVRQQLVMLNSMEEDEIARVVFSVRGKYSGLREYWNKKLQELTELEA